MSLHSKVQEMEREARSKSDKETPVDSASNSATPRKSSETPKAAQPDSTPNSEKAAANTPTRRVTRSQGKNKATRAPPSTEPSSEQPVQDTSLASTSKRTLEETEAETPPDRRPPPPAPVPAPPMALLPVPMFDPTPSEPHPVLPGQYTFLAASPSMQVQERRGPRTRTAQPIPVPNLTKKSRGRRVPTTGTPEIERQPSAEKEPHSKPSRVYVCQVPSCGKCFSRGEHLKRHIRSIHTHEKPFKCTYPDCDKFFNRHDNLLQHQKVHKDFSSSSNREDNINGPSQNGASQQQQNGHPHQHYVFRGAPPRNIVTAPPAYSPFATPYQPGPVSPSVGFTTNMAVSSLRTELEGPSNGEPRAYYRTFEHPESPQQVQYAPTSSAMANAGAPEARPAEVYYPSA